LIVAQRQSALALIVAQVRGPNGVGSRNADLGIADSGTPQAFLDADAFVKGVEHVLGASYLASHPIYVEGHSLGGAEAQYVGAVDHLSGVSFGAPGTLTPQYGGLALDNPSSITSITAIRSARTGVFSLRCSATRRRGRLRCSRRTRSPGAPWIRRGVEAMAMREGGRQCEKLIP
jgi:hypothetical protein